MTLNSIKFKEFQENPIKIKRVSRQFAKVDFHGVSWCALTWNYTHTF